MKIIALLVLVGLAASTYAYTTSGNTIIDPNGKPILLRGICRPSLEWSTNGQNISNNDWNVMKSWGANVIRIPLNQCFWNNNENGYQKFVDDQVNYIITTLKMGVILDLHWSDQGGKVTKCDQQKMADSNSITFWTSVASKYKANEWVVFELYNEPHDVTFDVWKNGGTVDGWTTPGFQRLYNAVRVTAGAPNAVIINGLNWAYDLSGVASYPISGSNIIFGTHPYDYTGKQPSDWDSGFGYLAANYPVIATEFGNLNCNTAYYSSFLDYANRKDISWTAWAWFVSGCAFPSVINGWDYTPTAPGSLIKAQLQSGPKVPSSAASTTKAPSSTTTNAPSTTKAPATTTKAPATTTVGSTTKAPTTTASSGTKITVVVNNGTNQYWLHVDRFTNSNKAVVGCQFADTASGSSWTSGFTETWGPGWTWNPNRVIAPPISLKITASDGTVLTLPNVISTAAVGSYLSSVNF